MLNKIWKVESKNFVHTLNSQKTPHTLQVWTSYGTSFFSSLEKHTARYRECIVLVMLAINFTDDVGYLTLARIFMIQPILFIFSWFTYWQFTCLQRQGIFTLRPFRPKGCRGCLHPSVRPSVRLSVNYLVRTITHHIFELESPNLHQTCILGYSQLVLKILVIDLHLQRSFWPLWLRILRNLVCPRNHSSQIYAGITKFAPNMRLGRLLPGIENRGHWPWPSRSFWPFWLRILGSWTCPDDNSSEIRAIITKFAPNMCPGIFSAGIENRGHWPWTSRSSWPFWLRILGNLVCLRNNSSQIWAGITKFIPNMHHGIL